MSRSQLNSPAAPKIGRSKTLGKTSHQKSPRVLRTAQTSQFSAASAAQPARFIDTGTTFHTNAHKHDATEPTSPTARRREIYHHARDLQREDTHNSNTEGSNQGTNKFANAARKILMATRLAMASHLQHAGDPGAGGATDLMSQVMEEGDASYACVGLSDFPECALLRDLLYTEEEAGCKWNEHAEDNAGNICRRAANELMQVRCEARRVKSQLQAIPSNWLGYTMMEYRQHEYTIQDSWQIAEGFIATVRVLTESLEDLCHGEPLPMCENLHPMTKITLVDLTEACICDGCQRMISDESDQVQVWEHMWFCAKCNDREELFNLCQDCGPERSIDIAIQELNSFQPAAGWDDAMVQATCSMRQGYGKFFSEGTRASSGRSGSRTSSASARSGALRKRSSSRLTCAERRSSVFGMKTDQLQIGLGSESAKRSSSPPDRQRLRKGSTLTPSEDHALNAYPFASKLSPSCHRSPRDPNSCFGQSSRTSRVRRSKTMPQEHMSEWDSSASSEPEIVMRGHSSTRANSLVIHKRPLSAASNWSEQVMPRRSSVASKSSRPRSSIQSTRSSFGCVWSVIASPPPSPRSSLIPLSPRPSSAAADSSEQPLPRHSFKPWGSRASIRASVDPVMSPISEGFIRSNASSAAPLTPVENTIVGAASGRSSSFFKPRDSRPSTTHGRSSANSTCSSGHGHLNSTGLDSLASTGSPRHLAYKARELVTPSSELVTPSPELGTPSSPSESGSETYEGGDVVDIEKGPVLRYGMPMPDDSERDHPFLEYDFLFQVSAVPLRVAASQDSALAAARRSLAGGRIARGSVLGRGRRWPLSEGDPAELGLTVASKCEPNNRILDEDICMDLRKNTAIAKAEPHPKTAPVKPKVAPHPKIADAQPFSWPKQQGLRRPGVGKPPRRCETPMLEEICQRRRDPEAASELPKRLKHRARLDRRMLARVEGEEVARRLMPALLAETAAEHSDVEGVAASEVMKSEACDAAIAEKAHGTGDLEAHVASGGRMIATPCSHTTKPQRSAAAVAEAVAISRRLFVRNLAIGPAPSPEMAEFMVETAKDIDTQVWRATTSAWRANLAKHVKAEIERTVKVGEELPADKIVPSSSSSRRVPCSDNINNQVHMNTSPVIVHHSSSASLHAELSWKLHQGVQRCLEVAWLWEFPMTDAQWAIVQARVDGEDFMKDPCGPSLIPDDWAVIREHLTKALAPSRGHVPVQAEEETPMEHPRETCELLMCHIDEAVRLVSEGEEAKEGVDHEEQGPHSRCYLEMTPLPVREDPISTPDAQAAGTPYLLEEQAAISLPPLPAVATTCLAVGSPPPKPCFSAAWSFEGKAVVDEAKIPAEDSMIQMLSADGFWSPDDEILADDCRRGDLKEGGDEDALTSAGQSPEVVQSGKSRAGSRAGTSSRAGASTSASTWACTSPIDRMPTPSGRRPKSGDYWSRHHDNKCVFTVVRGMLSPRLDEGQDLAHTTSNEYKPLPPFFTASVVSESPKRKMGGLTTGMALRKTPLTVRRWLNNARQYDEVPDLPLIDDAGQECAGNEPIAM